MMVRELWTATMLDDPAEGGMVWADADQSAQSNYRYARPGENEAWLTTVDASLIPRTTLMFPFVEPPGDEGVK